MAVFDCRTGELREETPEELAHIEAERAALAALVPESVSPVQMRLALRQAGLRDQVEAFVAQQTPEVQDAWEYATEVRRDNTMLAGGAAALGMTEEQIDDLFRLARSIVL